MPEAGVPVKLAGGSFLQYEDASPLKLVVGISRIVTCLVILLAQTDCKINVYVIGYEPGKTVFGLNVLALIPWPVNVPPAGFPVNETAE